MLFYADTHTHTLASTHAYSTILENAKYASEIGVSCIAMTDHAPEMSDAPHIWHFQNIKSVPAELFGVRILRGVEVDLRTDGSVDLEEWVLKQMEWVVLSLHSPVYGEPRSIEENSQAYIKAAHNPYIDVIGHSGSADYPYDYERVIPIFAEYGKLVEINEHTFDTRQRSLENCRKIAMLCKKYNVRVVINSDAHFAYEIGKTERSLALLQEIGFNPELIVNKTKQKLDEYLEERAKRVLL